MGGTEDSICAVHVLDYQRSEKTRRCRIVTILIVSIILSLVPAGAAYYHVRKASVKSTIKYAPGMRTWAPTGPNERQELLVLAANMGPTRIENFRVNKTVNEIVDFKDFAHWGPYRHPSFPDGWGLIIFWVDYSSREYWIAHHPDQVNSADWIAGPFLRPRELINTEARSWYGMRLAATIVVLATIR